ncbi:M23 family metallopeptidase [Cellulomonas sp. APG4]|uniref:M23 family metallopeptidase n=1 Tax=Cellulomonas sp. APG4 TaxID=1538656 RepID=UPI001379F2AE|nr:M23 family metallopeptidase [Cellulomonas sp. APG4]NCT92230.1 M23 family metallopeptidase [Cellulomonas sp. APG4]
MTCARRDRPDGTIIRTAAVGVLVAALLLGAGPPTADATDDATSGTPARPDDHAHHRLPLEAATLVARFRAPAQPWGPGHRGIDLTGTGPVRTPADGVVTFSGVVVDRGVLTVTHDDGLRSSFEPVEGGLPVGTRVRVGDALATVARPQHHGGHCGPTSCLHWGVRRGETYVDPLSLLGAAEPVVLLPLG